MAIDYAALKTELQTDPKALGYANPLAAGADQTCADLLNTVGASGETVSNGVIDAYLVINATVPAEWAALSTQEKQRYQILTGAGQIDTANTNLQAAFQAMFGAGTATRTNLVALLTRPCSRAQALFGAGTAVGAWDIAHAMGRTG